MNPIIIALYLPQYYPFKENDEWWGKGFTEWTNVARAKPLFKGHYQPKIPADLGFYDLRLPIVREQQAQLAKYAGISGFCYWHYWFGNGRRLMWEVFDEVLKSGKPDFPFCLGWANHSWYAKNWNSSDVHGKDRMLIEQRYFGLDDYKRHFAYVVKAFKDDRYIKIDGKPVFSIYDSHALPDDFIPIWNDLAKQAGFENGIFFIANVYWNDDEQYWLSKGYSSVIKGRLFSYYKKNLIHNIWGHFRNIVMSHVFHQLGNLVKYQDVIDTLVNESEDSNEFVIPTIVPNFDHSPRSGRFGLVYHESTPELFRKHCMKAFSVVKMKKNPIIFLRSWNEWGEGNYMEPDLKYGMKYIEVLHECVISVKKNNYDDF